MSTRGLYHFEDGQTRYTVYKHYDNYPSGALEAITKTLPLTWELPSRYEADEFAAAFIAANKTEPGGVRLVPAGTIAMNQDYDYYLYTGCDDSIGHHILKVRFDWYDDNGQKHHFDGPLKDMATLCKKHDL